MVVRKGHVMDIYLQATRVNILQKTFNKTIWSMKYKQNYFKTNKKSINKKLINTQTATNLPFLTSIDFTKATVFSFINAYINIYLYWHCIIASNRIYFNFSDVKDIGCSVYDSNAHILPRSRIIA